MRLTCPRAAAAANSMYSALRKAPITVCTDARSASKRRASSRSIATTSSTLTMTMTMSSSSREKARSPRTAASPRHRGEVPHRQEYPERQDQHQYAHDYQQDRLELGGQALDVDRHLALVHVGNLGHQRVD